MSRKQIALMLLLAGLRLVLVAGELERNGPMLFQTHFAVTGRMKVSLVISNKYTYYSYDYPFTLQRQGNQWRMRIAAVTNAASIAEAAVHQDIGCDGTNIYLLQYDFSNPAISNRVAGQVYPKTICMVPNADLVWFAFCRDLVSSSDKPEIPHPGMQGYINHWAHIYLHDSSMIHCNSQNEVEEYGWFVVDKERLQRAHLSPYLLTQQKFPGIPFAPGETSAVYRAFFVKSHEGMFLQNQFIFISYWGKQHPESDAYCLPNTDRALTCSFEYEYYALNEKEFSCYPNPAGRMIDAIDYRLWNKEKGMFSHLYKSTNFLGSNELSKASYVLDVAKIVKEKTRGQKSLGSGLPLLIALIAMLLGPLGCWLLVIKNKPNK